MASRRIFRGLLMPAAAVVGAASVPHTCNKAERLSKPSELPIYASPCQACKVKKVEAPPSELESNIGKIRKELWVWQDGVRGYRERVIDVYNTGVAHSSGPCLSKCCQYGRNHLAATLDFDCSLPSTPPKPGVNFVKAFKCNRRYSC